MTTPSTFNLLIALSEAQTNVRDLSAHRRDALQASQEAEERLTQIATQHADMTEAAWKEFTTASERWESEGAIDPVEAQTVILRAIEAFATSAEAVRDLVAAARTVVGAAAQAAVIADGEVEFRAQQLALEAALGGTATPLVAQA
jgi:hypothetical protein